MAHSPPTRRRAASTRVPSSMSSPGVAITDALGERGERDDSYTCQSCGRVSDVNAPDFAEWEATEDGQMICPVCLTPEEQQAIDEEAISLTEQIKRGKYEWLRW